MVAVVVIIIFPNDVTYNTVTNNPKTQVTIKMLEATREALWLVAPMAKS